MNLLPLIAVAVLGITCAAKILDQARKQYPPPQESVTYLLIPGNHYALRPMAKPKADSGPVLVANLDR
jgi:hypothetical protein